MAKQEEKIGIEEGDFITPKKAITISTISLIIWFVTGLSFKLLTIVGVKLPYESYALVISLGLSIAFSVYVVRKLVMHSDMLMRIIIGILNTILIYTSANGAQATYSFLSPVETSSVQTGSLIPFLDARPWIPDKFLKSENEILIKENGKLIAEKDDLTKQNDLLQSRITELRKPVPEASDYCQQENRLLRDSISMLANNFADCQKRNAELSEKLRKLISGRNSPKNSALTDSLFILRQQNSECLKNNYQINRMVETLRGRIQQFNNRQGLWGKRTGVNVMTRRNAARLTARDLTVAIKQQVNKVMGDSTYYDFLFLTPINDK